MLPITSSGPSTPFTGPADVNNNHLHHNHPQYRKSHYGLPSSSTASSSTSSSPSGNKYVKHYCHQYTILLQNNPNNKRSLFIVGTVLFILGSYLWFTLSSYEKQYNNFENYSDLNDKNKRIYFPTRFPDLFEKAMYADLTHTKVHFDISDYYSIIHENQQSKLLLYLTALHHSVSVMELPLTVSLRKALKDCEYYEKPSIYDSSSQHAIELKFPELLRLLDKVGDILENGRDGSFHHIVHLLQLLHPQAITISLGSEGEKEGQTGETDGLIIRTKSNSNHHRQHYHSNHLANRKKHQLNSEGLEEGEEEENEKARKSSFLDEHRHVFEEPLIYYVNSYFYSVVHCTHHPQVKEDWRSGFRYLQEIAPMVVSATEWKDNEGLDFLSPATHPKAGLFITSLVDSAPNVHRFSRQAFMRVDFDLTGYSPKDIVVPYYVATTPSSSSNSGESSNNIVPATIDGTQDGSSSISSSGASIHRSYIRRDMEVDSVGDGVEKVSKSANSNGDKEKLLVFIGHDHPIGGIRSQFKRELHKLSDVRDVLFVTYDGEESGNTVIESGSSSYSSASSSVKYSERNYRELLRKATFCLSIRGDTSSAARLFTIIDIGGCIPIIISDWQPLPFESIIDYSKFSMRFSERVVHDLPAMLTLLRNVSPQKIQSLQQGLQKVKSLLLFENSEHNLSILNPVSLTLIEFMQKREEYCRSLNDVNLPPLCMKIMNRLHIAEHLLREKKISGTSLDHFLPKGSIELKTVV